MSYAGTDTDRRLGNVISIGRVKAVDPAKGLVRVDFDGVLSDWIPWTAPQAGGNRTWSCPDEGEQVVVAAPSGELGNAVVIGSLFQDASPEPSTSGDVSKTVFKDGAVVEYDRAGHTYLVDIPGGGSITLRCGASTIVISDEGVAITSPTLTHNGKDVGDTHKHTGVVPGGGISDVPV